MNPEMQYSDDGLSITEQFEGCKLTAYKDSGGVWTNGYGNTHGVIPGSTITQEQAIADLRANIQTAVNAVNRLVTVQLSQNQFDACCDLVFNIGEGNFKSSTLLKLLNAGDFQNAALEFEKWDKCNGQVLDGLLNRRQAEEKEFNGSAS